MKIEQRYLFNINNDTLTHGLYYEVADVPKDTILLFRHDVDTSLTQRDKEYILAVFYDLWHKLIKIGFFTYPHTDFFTVTNGTKYRRFDVDFIKNDIKKFVNSKPYNYYSDLLYHNIKEV